MSRYSSLHQIPQSAPFSPAQVRNNAGGFVYTLDKWKRLERFLILGSDSPTYYQKAPELTRENAAVVTECWTEDFGRTYETILAIRLENRAPRVDALIFALALGAVHPNEKTRQVALLGVGVVCQTSTHLFQFVDNARSLGKGFGRAMVRAVANWYESKPIDRVAYQAVKYRQRDGWTHKRLLDLSHPGRYKTNDKARGDLYAWMVGKPSQFQDLPPIVQDFIGAQAAGAVGTSLKSTLASRLPWEALPTEWLNDPEVWKALVPNLGLIALVRNLGRLSALGLIAPFSLVEKTITAKLRDENEISASRIHPYQLLTALMVYKSGQGVLGRGRWEVMPSVVQALNDSFYKSFRNVNPSGKRILVALDISGSMTSGFIGGIVSARAASSAMALITMKREPETHIVGFCAGHTAGGQAMFGRSYSLSDASIAPLNISAGQRLDDVMAYTESLDFGRTDCALPALYAAERSLDVDAIVIYTDNETWAGPIHPVQALDGLRKRLGHDVKQIVVGMTATSFSIADPNDPSSLDVVGFDSAAPALISDFIRAT